MKRIILALMFMAAGIAGQAQMTKKYTNPVLSGFYPDPSICRVNDDYYLISSTFAYFPGIPVFHSKDLVHWQLIGHVMSRPEQMDLTGFGVSRGIFAPAIRYRNGLFYVTCTLVDGKGNFVATAKNPAGPWSNPVWLPQIDGIDPCLFFDDNGKTYIIYNSIPPDNKSLYNGHRTIRIRSFDLEHLKAMDDERILVNGGTDISKKPSWIEGPHLLKKDGYYYLVAAEGGTGYDHSVVAFRSKTIEGPFIPYEHNPVLTQRNLDASRSFPITSTGHADLVETPEGWQAVFLGCRPYEGDFYNTGRETFLTPVVWKDGWPLLNPGQNRVQFSYPLPLPGKTQGTTVPAGSGNFSYRDDFKAGVLDAHWMFLRTPREKWYSIDKKRSTLSLQLRPFTCAGKANPSFLARRQQHLQCSATTALTFTAASSNEKAGLCVFQNEDHFYYLCGSVENGQRVVQLYQSALLPADSNRMQLIATYACKGNSLQLKITADKTTYSFYVSEDGHSWNPVKEGLDARFLSTRIAGGFVGCTFALYATSLGLPSSSKAHYDWFAYEGHDEMY